MISASAKIIISVLLSLTAVLLFAFLGGRSRKECMIAMLLSSIGDVFMVDGVINWSMSTYVGAAFFMAAHIIYAGCAVKNAKERCFEYKNGGFRLGLWIMILSALLLGVLAFTVPEKPVPIMFFLILIYIAVIGYNLCSQFSFGFSAKGVFYVLPIAIFVFYLTDIFIFLDMLDIEHSLRNLVWYGYPPAQLGLILFNSPLKKEK